MILKEMTTRPIGTINLTAEIVDYIKCLHIGDEILGDHIDRKGPNTKRIRLNNIHVKRINNLRSVWFNFSIAC